MIWCTCRVKFPIETMLDGRPVRSRRFLRYSLPSAYAIPAGMVVKWLSLEKACIDQNISVRAFGFLDFCKDHRSPSAQISPYSHMLILASWDLGCGRAFLRRSRDEWAFENVIFNLAGWFDCLKIVEAFGTKCNYWRTSESWPCHQGKISLRNGALEKFVVPELLKARESRRGTRLPQIAVTADFSWNSRVCTSLKLSSTSLFHAHSWRTLKIQAIEK